MRPQRGNALFTVALFSTALMGFTAMAVDVGVNTQTRTRMQSAADAAALAGAKVLLFGQEEARVAAMDFAQRNQLPITAGNVTFPAPNQIQVQWSRSVDGLFSRVVGIQQFQVPVAATAEVGSLTGGRRMRPWGVPCRIFRTTKPARPTPSR